MEIVIYILLGIFIGSITAYLFANKHYKNNISIEKGQFDLLKSKCDSLEDENNKKSIEIASLSKEKEYLIKEIEEGKLDKKEELEVVRKEVTEQINKMQLLFKDSANEILKEKLKDLGSSNSEQIKNILDPLNKKMEEFKSAVEDSKEKSIKNTTTIEQQIKSMIEHTNSISKEANNLASALKSNNKTLGNWGEVILQNLLENMGLKLGGDFIIQESIKDVDGNTIKNEDNNRKMIPDTVLFLPDNKAIVIDSKVSLNGYVDYVNAETDDLRAEALKNHFKSVEGHIKELSTKNYSHYIKQTGKDSLEYVVMFIPNEGAFQLYYQNFQEAWHSAFEKKIIISGESNLFAMLKIIDAAWVQIKQQKNLEEVMIIAGELLDRVAKFANTFDDVGVTIEKSVAKFEDARRILSGRQSIVVTSRKLEGKGVRMREKFHSKLLQEGQEGDEETLQ